MVDALTVKDAHLIVKPLVAISGREEVALKLGTHVAAGTLVTIGTVIDGSQFEGSLRIVAEAHVERAQGILETNGALELTELDAQEVVFLPLDKGIHDTRSLVGAGSTVYLYLKAVVEVVEAVTGCAQTDKTEVETAVRGLAVSIVDAVLTDDVSAELDAGVHGFEQFLGPGGFLLCRSGLRQAVRGNLVSRQEGGCCRK